MSVRSLRIYLFILSTCINYTISYKSDISTEDCLAQRVKPDNLNYLSLKIINKDTDHPSYNLEVESQAERAGAPYGARFLTVQNGNCSAQCTHQIVAFRPRNRDVRTHRTILYALDFQETMIASNYQDVKMDSPIRCARQFGFCGATIGLYRHFRYTPGGLLNAYSFSSQVNIRGFTREYYPMCYLWTLPDDLKIIGNANIPGRSPRATTSMCMSNESMPIKELQLLRVYDNNASGTQRDHYYTITTNDTNSDLVGYVEQEPLGRVALSPSSSCDCLTKIVQMVDKQEGIFRRLDHKIVIEGGEANRPYEQYVATGEYFYCASDMACGATLPLWKSFHYFDVDSVITTNSEPVPYAYLYPQLPLCYIWPVNDDSSTSTNPSIGAPPDTTLTATTTVSALGVGTQPTVSISPETDLELETTTNTVSFPGGGLQTTTLWPEVGAITTPPQDFLSTPVLPTDEGLDEFPTVAPTVDDFLVTDTPVDVVDELTTLFPPTGVEDGLPTVIPTTGVDDGLPTDFPLDGETDIIPTTIPVEATTPSIDSMFPSTGMPISGNPATNLNNVLPEMSNYLINLFFGYENNMGTIPNPSDSTLKHPVNAAPTIPTLGPIAAITTVSNNQTTHMTSTTPTLVPVADTTTVLNTQPTNRTSTSPTILPIADTTTVLNTQPTNGISTSPTLVPIAHTTPVLNNQTTHMTSTTPTLVPVADTTIVLNTQPNQISTTIPALEPTAFTTNVLNTLPIQMPSTSRQSSVPATQSTVVATTSTGNGHTLVILPESQTTTVSNASVEFIPTTPGLVKESSMTDNATSSTVTSSTSIAIKPNATQSTVDSKDLQSPISSVDHVPSNDTIDDSDFSIKTVLPLLNELSAGATLAVQTTTTTTTDTPVKEPMKEPDISLSRDIFSYSIPKVV